MTELRIIQLSPESIYPIGECLLTMSPSFPVECMGISDEAGTLWKDWDSDRWEESPLWEAWHNWKGPEFILNVCRQYGSPNAIVEVKEDNGWRYSIQAYTLDSKEIRRRNKFNERLQRALSLNGERHLFVTQSEACLKIRVEKHFYIHIYYERYGGRWKYHLSIGHEVDISIRNIWGLPRLMGKVHRALAYYQREVNEKED